MEPAALATAVAAGDATAIRQFRAQVDQAGRATDGVEFGALLDAVALESARSDAARYELLAAVRELRLAERAIRRILNDPHDVDDAVQATLLQIDRNVGQYEGGDARFTSWLYRVAQNEALQLMRTKGRNVARDERGAPDRQEVFTISSLVADQDALRNILASMSDHHREVLVLREVEELDYEEIAIRLGIPVGTVRSRLARARDEFAGLVTQHIAETRGS